MQKLFVLLAIPLFLVAGCTPCTELFFYEDGILSEKDMAKFLGEYTVEFSDETLKNSGDKKPPSFTAKFEKTGTRFNLSLKPSQEKEGKTTKYEGMLFSKIPNSEGILISWVENVRQSDGSNAQNFYFGIAKRIDGDPEKIYFWTIDPKKPIAKNNLKTESNDLFFFTEQVLTANETKKFLSKHADNYMRVNSEFVRFKRIK